MVHQLLNSAAQDQRVNEAIAAYLKAVEAGDKPDRQQWLARYPELADELAAFFADQDQFDRLAEPLRAVLPPTPGPADTVTIDSSARSEIRQFGDYELFEEIGRGGMGVVYRARQIKLNRTVALKMIRAGELATATEVQRFHAEAEAAAHLDHPHIVPIYEVGEDQGQQYFSMKLIEGGSLAQWSGVTSAGSVVRKEEQKQAARMLATVTRAVHYAHQRGILHRDLKPSNILLDTQGQPYVSDFGLAKRVATASQPELASQSGTIVGTPSYMAPEQAAGNKGLSCSVDIFSLGCMLYELLTGRPPFKGATPLDTLIQVRDCEPACPRTLNVQIDRDLETICLKCLQKEPQRRYGSAEALAKDLERWLAGEPIQARPTGRVEQLWRWSRRNPLVASLIAIVLLVTLGGFFGVLDRWQVALANERKADEKAVQAQEKEQEANQQRDEARALAEKLQAALEHLRRTTYSAHMNLAQHAWEAGGVERVRELLEQHRPKAGESDQRGFEWFYLNRLCHAELLTLRHTCYLTSVAYSPDGKSLASASYDGTVKVWDTQTGQELHSFKGGGGGVAYSPDGKRLASGSKVWDAQTGQELLSLQGGSGEVFSADSKRLAGISEDHRIKVWDAQTGQELLSLQGHTGDVRSVALSPDGKRLASASSDKTVKVWDVQTGRELFTLKGHSWYVTGVAFSPDGKRLASGSGYFSISGEVKVWDVQTGRELLSLKGGANSVVFSPDGKRLASGSSYFLIPGEVKVWDARTGQELLTFKGHSNRVNRVAFSPDGKRLASASSDATVKVWDAQAGPKPLTFKGHTDQVDSVAFSPDGKRLASTSWDNSMKVWDTLTGQELFTVKGAGGGVAYSPDGKRLASGSKVWDAQTGKVLLSLKGRGGNEVFSPDGKRLAGTSEDHTVRVWDARTGQELLSLKGDAAQVNSVAFSPDGKRLASGSGQGPNSTGEVKVWDAQTGQELLSLKGHTTPVYSVAFSSDGKRLASGSGVRWWRGPGEVKVWDAQTGQELLSLKHIDIVKSVAFSPDGKRLVSGGLELKVWDAQTGQELLSLKGHAGDANSVVFSPNGRWLASGSLDGTVKIWDATPLPEKP